MEHTRVTVDAHIFNGINVLLISPTFFGYEMAITEAFREAGASVQFVDERPSNLSVVRALYRLKPELLRLWTDRYFRGVARNNRDVTFDLILVIKAESVPAGFIRQVTHQHPEAIAVYYSFDTMRPSDNYRNLAEYFDYAYSFDRADVDRNIGLKYKSLFYTKEFTPGHPHGRRQRDLAFVGTINPARYSAVKSIAAEFEDSSIFFYAPARWYILIRGLIDTTFRAMKFRDISFNSLSRSEVADRFKSARVVLDLQKSGQSGLTMRTFEALATGAALVTTNERVRDEAFFSCDRIIVLNEWDPVAAIAAVRKLASGDLDGAPPPGFEQYSVSAWIAGFLSLLPRNIGTVAGKPRGDTGESADPPQRRI